MCKMARAISILVSTCAVAEDNGSDVCEAIIIRSGK